MAKIKTAVIPAGGWGTRFLPSTKSIPKEMFPLGTKPVILHVVEEIVNSGIENIIFVVSHHKQSIESFFSTDEALEDYYLKLGKKEEVERLRKITELAQYSFVYTKPPFGNGGALESVRHLVQDDPFLLVWSDEVIISKERPRARQVLDTFEKYGKPVISAVKIEDKSKYSRYGMAVLKDFPGETNVKEILRIAEKSQDTENVSGYAAHGAYALTPEVFKALDRTSPRDGELWLTDIVNNMQKETGLLAKIIEDGHYLDCGDPLSYLYSQVDYYLNYSKNAEEVRSYLKKKIL